MGTVTICEECSGYGRIPIPGPDENHPPKCLWCHGTGKTTNKIERRKSMNKEQYYIVVINEDGAVSVTENSAEDITGLFNPRGDWDAEIDPGTCNEEMPEQADPNYWGDKTVLIIKGKIVIPKPIPAINNPIALIDLIGLLFPIK